MKNAPMKICNETIHPGETLSLALPLPELFTCAPMYMPIKIVHGKTSGPTILVTAAMHGNEVNGTEIINRLLDLDFINKLKGTLIAIPVLNVYGLLNRSRTLPSGMELDRYFPGSETGSHAARLAHIFCEQILKKADYCIDLQTAELNFTNLPQVFVNSDNGQAKELAQHFGVPVISEVVVAEGSLREVTSDLGIPLLVYEAGEAMRFDEDAIKVGVRGIVNVMRKIGMLSEDTEQPPVSTKSFFTRDIQWIRAAASGVSHTAMKLGDHVKKNEVVSTIKDTFGARENLTVTAPEEGIIVGINNLPLVHEGERLFLLATLPQVEEAASHLEEWQEENTGET
jgi:predicted deacylase